MFTGLIEELGVVETLDNSGSAARIRIQAGQVASDAEIGDSIAINGCCLTVVERGPNALLGFDAVAETLSRTNLGELCPGDQVNLERALKPGDRMGGHYVTGHIDGLGVVAEIEEFDTWRKFWFEPPGGLLRQMASKGSVTVDGISLTLVDVDTCRFSVAVIPHTLQVTNLGHRSAGEHVNIETDLLAKYVQQQLDYLLPGSATKP